MTIKLLDQKYDKLSVNTENLEAEKLYRSFIEHKDYLRRLILSGNNEETVLSLINSRFKNEIFKHLLPSFTSHGLEGVQFGKLQIKDIYKIKFINVKTRNVTVELNWSKADQDVIDYIGDYGIDRSWYDQYTSLILQSNESVIKDSFQRFVRGEENLDGLTDRLERLLFSRERAHRVIRTGLTDVFAAGQQAAYRTAGTEKNRWYSKFDRHVCPICQPLHDEEVIIGQPFVGRIDKPPAHVGCRCYLSPVPLSKKEMFDKIEKMGLQKRGQGVKPPPSQKPAQKPVQKPSPSQKPVPIPLVIEDESTIVQRLIDDSYKENDKFIVKLDDLNIKIAEKKSAIDLYDQNKWGAIPPTKEQIKKYYDDARELNFLLGERENLGVDLREAIVDIIALPKDRQSSLKLSGDHQVNLDRSIKFLDKIIDKKLTVNLTVDVDANKATNRAKADPGKITINDKTTTATVIHEMGHVVEFHNTQSFDRFIAEIDSRTQGETPQKMSTLTGNTGYKDYEVATPDKFLHAYIGRRYMVSGVRATEYFSMWVQLLYENPSMLMSDRRYFEDGLRFIRGL